MGSLTHEAFRRLLNTLYYGALDKRDRGTRFETLMRSDLLPDRTYSFSNMYPWNEYTEKGNRTEIGIDLVGVRAVTGEKVAIQCKLQDPRTNQ